MSHDTRAHNRLDDHKEYLDKLLKRIESLEAGVEGLEQHITWLEEHR